MENTVIKTIELDNGQTLVVHDRSRKIAADTWVVIADAQMKIRIQKELFVVEQVSEAKLADILDMLGDHIVYRYKMERNMIREQEKEDVLRGLVETFLANTGQYVCKPQFPEKLVLKEYRERIEKRKRYNQG